MSFVEALTFVLKARNANAKVHTIYSIMTGFYGYECMLLNGHTTYRIYESFKQQITFMCDTKMLDTRKNWFIQ